MSVYGIDSVAALAAHFGRIPVEMRTVLRPQLLRAGGVVQRAAQANASWSSRIPGAISVGASVSRSGGVTVKVDSSKAPHARPYEGAGGRGTFRHPVYGNREVWVTQATRPFLFPAVKSSRPEVVGLISEAVKSVTHL